MASLEATMANITISHIFRRYLDGYCIGLEEYPEDVFEVDNFIEVLDVIENHRAVPVSSKADADSVTFYSKTQYEYPNSVLGHVETNLILIKVTGFPPDVLESLRHVVETMSDEIQKEYAKLDHY